MKARILTLLDEIKEVCEKEKIPFFLSGELVYRANKGGELKEKFSDASVLIFAEHAERFSQKLLSGKKQRSLESLKSNPSFPGFYLRYCDTGTTLISTREERFSYEHNCIGVNVELICGLGGGGFKKKLLNRFKKAWTENFCPDYIKEKMTEADTGKRQLGDSMIRAFLKVFGTKSMMNRLFDAWVRQGSKTSERCMVTMTNSLQCTFKRGMFQSQTPVQVEGKEYPAPARVGGYLKNIYADPAKRKPQKDILYDTQVPWQQYSQALKQEGLDLKKIQKKRRKYLEWRNEVYTPLLEKRIYYYSLIFCSEDRVKLWREYSSGKKDQVLELYRSGQYEEAGELLGDYVELLRYYGEKEIGFCFDPEILETAIKLLILDIAATVKTKKGYNKKCSRLLEIVESVPYQHFDKIENAFFGDRTQKEVLEKEKSQVYDRLTKFSREHCVKQ